MQVGGCCGPHPRHRTRKVKPVAMRYEFTYKPKLVNIVLAFALGVFMLSGGLYGVLSGAQLARRAVVLSPEVSFAIFVAVLLVGVFFLVWGIRMVAAGKRQIVVTSSYIEAPRKAASRSMIRIETREIHNVSIVNDPVNGQSIVVNVNGKNALTLPRNAFDNGVEFERCSAAINWARAPQTTN